MLSPRDPPAVRRTWGGAPSPAGTGPAGEQLYRVPANRSRPFVECHWYEDPVSSMQACVFNLRQYRPGNRMPCAAGGLRRALHPAWRPPA